MESNNVRETLLSHISSCCDIPLRQEVIKRFGDLSTLPLQQLYNVCEYLMISIDDDGRRDKYRQ